LHFKSQLRLEIELRLQTIEVLTVDYVMNLALPTNDFENLESLLNIRKKFRSYKEALNFIEIPNKDKEFQDVRNPFGETANTFRVIKAMSFWTSFLFNILFIIRNWIIRPERDSSEQFNLSQLIIVWVEFLVILALLLVVISFFLIIQYGGNQRVGMTHSFLNYCSKITRFSTINAMRFLNPANFLYYLRTWKDNFKRYSMLQASYAGKRCGSGGSVNGDGGAEEQEQRGRWRWRRKGGKKKRFRFINAIASYLSNTDTTCGIIFYYLCLLSLLFSCLVLGTMSFAVKAKALSFLSDKKPLEWDFSEVYSFFGFFFQLSNISVHSRDRMMLVRSFIFAGDNLESNEQESERQLVCLRSIYIKLLEKYGFIKGVLYRGATMDERDLHNLFVEGFDTPNVASNL